jgi:hypothetical protein
VPAIPSFVASEVVADSGFERAFVVCSGVLGVSGSSYICQLQGDQWHTSVMTRIGDDSSSSDGGGVYVGSPVVSVLSHVPIAASPPSNVALFQPQSLSGVVTELSLLACDGNACRSTLLRSSLGIQVCFNSTSCTSQSFMRCSQATLFTPKPLSIGSPDNPVLGLHAVPLSNASSDEFIVIS